MASFISQLIWYARACYESFILRVKRLLNKLLIIWNDVGYYKLFGLLSTSLIRNYFPKLPSGAPLHTLSKLSDILFGFVTPLLFGGCVLLYLRSPKSGCCSISDDLSSSRTGIRQGTLENVIEKVLWSIRGSYQTIWSSSLTNANWHSVAWPSVTFLPNSTFYRLMFP